MMINVSLSRISARKAFSNTFLYVLFSTIVIYFCLSHSYAYVRLYITVCFIAFPFAYFMQLMHSRRLCCSKMFQLIRGNLMIQFPSNNYDCEPFFRASFSIGYILPLLSTSQVHYAVKYCRLILTVLCATSSAWITNNSIFSMISIC